MAQTLAQLKTICYYHGWSDTSDGGLAALTSFINQTLQQLSTLAPWPEYCKVDGSVTCGATETEVTITAFSDYSDTVAGATLVAAASHGFSNGDVVVISGTTNYDGEYRVYYVDADSFYIIKAYTELVTNGGFGEDSNWLHPDGWTINTGKLLGLVGTSEGDEVYQSIAITPGKSYQVQWDDNSSENGYYTVELGGTSTTYTKGVTNTKTLVAGSDDTFIKFVAIDWGAEIDNVSVKETGTAALQIDKNELPQTRIWRLGSVIRTDRSVPLDEVEINEWLRLKRYHAGSGSPTQYALERYIDDTSNAVRTRILTYPKHTASTTLYYTYQVYPKWLSSDTDYTDWPDTRLHLFTEAIRLRLLAQDHDTGEFSLFSPQFTRMVDKAYAFARPSSRPVIAKNSTYSDWKTPIERIEKTFTT